MKKIPFNDIIDLLLLAFLAVAMFGCIKLKQPLESGFYGILFGGYAMYLVMKQRKIVNPPIKADVTIHGTNAFLTHADAIKLCMQGYNVIRTYQKRKYKWFGKMVYYVDLQKPEPPKYTEADAMAFGRAVHNAIFNHENSHLEEISDEELERQERYEELAERKRRRESNNTQNS